MTKKEKKLYMNHGRKWDVIVKHLITFSYNDASNIIKCNECLMLLNAVCLKRTTIKLKLINKTLYFNTLYGGIEND